MISGILTSRGPLPFMLAGENNPKCQNCRYWTKPENKYTKQGTCTFFGTNFVNIKNRPEQAFIESYDEEAILRTRPDFYCAAFKQMEDEIHDSNRPKAA